MEKEPLKDYQQLVINICKRNPTMHNLRKVCCMGYAHPFTNTEADDDLVFRVVYDIWETYCKKHYDSLPYILDELEKTGWYSIPKGMPTTEKEHYIFHNRKTNYPATTKYAFLTYFISGIKLCSTSKFPDNYRPPAFFRYARKFDWQVVTIEHLDNKVLVTLMCDKTDSEGTCTKTKYEWDEHYKYLETDGTPLPRKWYGAVRDIKLTKDLTK